MAARNDGMTIPDLGQLTCEIASGVRATDQAFWDKCLPGDPEGYAYHAACEAAGRGAFELNAAVVRNDAQMLAAVPLFRVVYRVDTALQGAARKFSDRITKSFPKFGELPMIGLGSPYADACALALHPQLAPDQASAVTASLLAGIIAHAKATGAPLVAIKDLPQLREPGLAEEFSAARFARMSSLPVAALDLPYADVDGYLASLSASTRKDIRRKLKSAANVQIERRVGIADIRGEIRALYEETRGESALDYGDFETLPEFYFEAITDALGPRAVFVLYRIDGKLAAFNLLLVGQDRVIDKFLGMRKGVAQEHNLYAISWIENVKFCLENKIATLQSGQTAYTLKLRLGSRLEGSGIWFRHQGRIANAVLRAGAPWVAFDKLDPDLKAWRTKVAVTKADAKPDR